MRTETEKEPPISPLESMRLLYQRLEELERTYPKARVLPLNSQKRIKLLMARVSSVIAKLEDGTPLEALRKNPDLDPDNLLIRYSSLTEEIK
jgi:hypothetical protein